MTESKQAKHTLQAMQLAEKIVLDQGILLGYEQRDSSIQSWAKYIDDESGIPDLLAENERLRSQLAELQEAVDSYLNDCSCKHTLAIALQRSEGGELT